MQYPNQQHRSIVALVACCKTSLRGHRDIIAQGDNTRLHWKRSIINNNVFNSWLLLGRKS